MNSKETPPNEINHEKLYTNNFYCFLPGGNYRKSRCDNPVAKEIMDKLDELLVENPIDLDDFFEKMERANKMIIGALNMQNDNPEKAESLGTEGDKLQQEAQEIIYPLFQRMVEMGYNKNDLIA